MAVAEHDLPGPRPQPSPTAGGTAGVVSRLSRIDRLLPVWIAAAMAAGLGLGSLLPHINNWLGGLQVASVSLPIAIGLLLMMYPVLAKIRYEEIGKQRHDAINDRRFFGVSLLLSWLAGPALMFALAWLLLSDQPAYRTGVIIVGIPLAAGFLTRRLGLRRKGRDWYEHKLIPRIAPITLYGLLFTIILLFAIQGHRITSQPLDVVRIALPLLAYFAIMWASGFAAGRLLRLPYPQTASLALTVASNDFELAIAVAVGVFGASSGQALAGVVGPLIEVPVLVSLVYVALWLSRKLRWPPAPERGMTISTESQEATR